MGHAIADVDASGLWPGKVITEVVPASDYTCRARKTPGLSAELPSGYTCHFVRPSWSSAAGDHLIRASTRACARSWYSPCVVATFVGVTHHRVEREVGLASSLGLTHNAVDRRVIEAGLRAHI